jgi:hypothetical protein
MSGAGSVAHAFPDEPCVGLFWRVSGDGGSNTMLIDALPLSLAEAYGDVLTHPGGHYEVWSTWQRLGQAGLKARGWPLAILYSEYEDHPRGRVVFNVRETTFWILADRRLQRPASIAAIQRAFGLAGQACLVKSDEHYR